MESCVLSPSGRLNSAFRGKSWTVNDAVYHMYLLLDRVLILVAIADPRSSALNECRLLITNPASNANAAAIRAVSLSR